MRDLTLWRSAPSVGVLCVIFGVLVPAVARAQAAPAPAAPTTAPPAAVAPAAPPPAAAPPAAPPPGAVYAYPPPPGYTAYPPPGYGYPPPPYAYARRAPDTFPYQGGPIPQGFHYEERPRRGLIIAGSLVMGIPWALGVSIVSGSNFPNKTGWLVVPALGPWLTLAARHDSTCTNISGSGYCVDDGENTAARTILVLDGLMQTAGAVMLIAGLASPSKLIVRDFVGNLQFTPAPMGRQGYGGFVTGEF